MSKDVDAVLASLKRLGTKHNRDGMARYGIVAKKVFGVFAECLPLIESAATDDRNFVKKGVSWALRVIGRRSRELRAASIALARRLAESPDATARWIGRDALKDLVRA